MQTASAIENSYRVISEYQIDGEFWVELDCQDYAHYKSLPAGMTYKGYTLGKAGWNSDTYKVAYSTRWKIAKGV